MTILQVEDDDNDVCLVGMAARKANASTRAVSSVVEAQAYLEGRGRYADRDEYPFPDLILLDLMLPGKDGYEFLRWLRNTPWAAIPVVALTSSLDAHALERATAMGADLSFAKPTSFSDLVWLLGGVCGAVANPQREHSPLPI